MPILLEDEIISTLSFPETTIDINVSGESYSLDIALPSSEVFSIDIPGSGGVYLSGGYENNTLVVPDKSIAVVTFSEVGPAGPQGIPGQPANIMDAMINPDYPDTDRTFETGPYGITAIHVFDSDSIEIFTRTITYDTNGRAIQIQTDDLINSTRLIKAIAYAQDGAISGTSREVTTI